MGELQLSMQKEIQNYTLKIEEKDAEILKQRNEIDKKYIEVIAEKESKVKNLEEELSNSQGLFTLQLKVKESLLLAARTENEKLQSNMQEEKQKYILMMVEKDAQILKQKHEIDIGMNENMNKLDIIAKKDKKLKNLEEQFINSQELLKMNLKEQESLLSTARNENENL